MSRRVIILERALQVGSVPDDILAFLQLLRELPDPAALPVERSFLETLSSRLEIERGVALQNRLRKQVSAADDATRRAFADSVPPPRPDFVAGDSRASRRTLALLASGLSASLREAITAAIFDDEAALDQLRALDAATRREALDVLVAATPLGGVQNTGIYFRASAMERARKLIGHHLRKLFSRGDRNEFRRESAPDAGQIALCNAAIRVLLATAPDAQLGSAFAAVLVQSHPLHAALLFPRQLAACKPYPGAAQLVTILEHVLETVGPCRVALVAGEVTHVLGVEPVRVRGAVAGHPRLRVLARVSGPVLAQPVEQSATLPARDGRPVRLTLPCTVESELRVELGPHDAPADGHVELRADDVLFGALEQSWLPLTPTGSGEVELRLTIRELGMDTSGP